MQNYWMNLPLRRPGAMGKKIIQPDWDKCNLPYKEMFHGVCFMKCALNGNCSVNKKRCLALPALSPSQQKKRNKLWGGLKND